MEFITSNGVRYTLKEAEQAMNNPDLLKKIQEFKPEITHFPGNWEFISLQKKLDWFTENVPGSLFINWFSKS